MPHIQKNIWGLPELMRVPLTESETEPLRAYEGNFEITWLSFRF